MECNVGQNIALIGSNVSTKQVPSTVLVFRIKNRTECLVTIFFVILHLVLDIAVNHDSQSYHDYNYRSHDSSEVHNHGNKECRSECNSGSHEPASDHRQYAGHAIDRALPAPGPVRKRGTHSDHKCHICSRERQLEGSSQSDQKRRNHKVYRRSYKVV